MTLTSGTKLGPYEILSAIGVGGMGEVYKARDTRLNRMVAIKVLPSHFSDNAEMKARFDREAQTIAGLNHSHICVLYDVGHQDGTDYLVMEYLEGQTLAQRLEKGALPLDEALKIAIEIADALDKAHRHRVVHRDLKPSNVMLTKSGAKLLDFGLAKLKQEAQPVSTFSALPTNADVTAKGTILGTLQYMAPEQLEGEEADARTDIFAFGALLYEMVTSTKAFAGKSQASLISAIMSAEPRPVSQLQPMAPPLLEHLLATCLEKNPDERWQTAHDVLIELRWIEGRKGDAGDAASSTGSRRKRRKFVYVQPSPPLLSYSPWRFPPSAIFAVMLRRKRSVSWSRRRMHQSTLLIFLYPPMAAMSFSLPGHRSQKAGFSFRDLRSTIAKQLPGTESAQRPFWSPDSRSLAFVTNGTLKRIDIAGGLPQTISNFGGPGSWNGDGVIVFSARNILYRVSALGGEPEPVTMLDESKHETSHFWPHFLPDGHHFLYTVWADQETNRGIYVGSLNSKTSVKLVTAPSMAQYAAPDHLLYQRDGALFAQPFDAASLVLTGEPIRVVDTVGVGGFGRAAFTESQTGILVYRSGLSGATRQFTWFDRQGKEIGPAVEAGAYPENFSLSEDAKQLAFTVTDSGGRSDIWLLDLTRGVRARFTYDGLFGTYGRNVVWSPDGSQLAFDAQGTGNSADIYVKSASGVGAAKLVVGSPNQEYVEDWSKDGRYIVYCAWAPNPTDIWAMPLFGDRKAFPILQSPFRKDEPHLSFDGKWLAYDSDESGNWQIYVVSFPKADQKRQISTNGGAEPRWRRDGKELYYLGLDGKLMSVDMVTDTKLDSGIPRALFNAGLSAQPNVDQYAATPDGQRFLVLKPIAEATTPPLTVVVNWTAALNKK